MQGWAEKRAFRLRWAAAKMEEAISKKVRRTIVKEAWKKRGRYMSFRKIWEEEGLDEAGFKALLVNLIF